jgi:hypothetical protein
MQCSGEGKKSFYIKIQNTNPNEPPPSPPFFAKTEPKDMNIRAKKGYRKKKVQFHDADKEDLKNEREKKIKSRKSNHSSQVVIAIVIAAPSS